MEFCVRRSPHLFSLYVERFFVFLPFFQQSDGSFNGPSLSLILLSVRPSYDSRHSFDTHSFYLTLSIYSSTCLSRLLSPFIGMCISICVCLSICLSSTSSTVAVSNCVYLLGTMLTIHRPRDEEHEVSIGSIGGKNLFRETERPVRCLPSQGRRSEYVKKEIADRTRERSTKESTKFSSLFFLLFLLFSLPVKPLWIVERVSLQFS